VARAAGGGSSRTISIAADQEGERGGATGVELALLWGVMLTLVLAVVQIGLLFYAGQLALTAAQTGVNSARTPTGVAVGGGAGETAGSWSIADSADDARRDSEEFLARAAGDVLSNVTITTQVDQANATVQVTVTGDVLSVLPGITPTVVRQAAGGLEQVAP
jgi:Flp pilus assembly protein TadG